MEPAMRLMELAMRLMEPVMRLMELATAGLRWNEWTPCFGHLLEYHFLCDTVREIPKCWHPFRGGSEERESSSELL